MGRTPEPRKEARLDALNDTIVFVRRLVGMAGATFVALGFLGAILAMGHEPFSSEWVFVTFILLIPAGFVLLWEAQIAWPRDGSPYPWQRRGACFLVAMVSFAAMVAVGVLLGVSLPDHWLAHAIAQGGGVSFGLLLYKQLRQLVTRRLEQDEGQPQKTAPA